MTADSDTFGCAVSPCSAVLQSWSLWRLTSLMILFNLTSCLLLKHIGAASAADWVLAVALLHLHAWQWSCDLWVWCSPGLDLSTASAKQELCGIYAFKVSPWIFTRAWTHGFVAWEGKVVWKALLCGKYWGCNTWFASDTKTLCVFAALHCRAWLRRLIKWSISLPL